MQQQSGDGEQAQHQQRDQQGLRAAHHVVLRAQADCVDVDPEVFVLRTRGDIAEVEQQRGDQRHRRDDAGREADPALGLGPLISHWKATRTVTPELSRTVTLKATRRWLGR